MTKRTSKFKKLTAAAVLAAAIFGADAAGFAQCPGGNCSAYRGTSNTGAGYYWYYPGWSWGNPFGWAWSYQRPAVKQAENADAAKAEPEQTPLDEIPEWKPAEPTPEPEPAAGDDATETDAEPADAEEPNTGEPADAELEIPVCPLAALTADLINKARTERGLPPLTIDRNLSAACERHSAYMRARGFGHAADGGRECIAEGYSTPAATVAAWLASSGHAAIILGHGTRIGIGVVGRYYTLRVR